jgi:dihydroorotase
MGSILIKNGQIYYQEKLQKLDLLIDNGLIVKIDTIINQKTDSTIDASQLVVLPGLVDIHVHLREPGFENKETIKTGTQAAAAGGFTTICCMPNLNPVTDSEDNIKYLISLIKKDAIVNVLPYASITINEEGNYFVNFSALSRSCFAFSDDGVGIEKKRIMEGAMVSARPLHKAIVAHCEDKNYSGNESEYRPIARDIEFARKTHCHYHVCHISTKESVNFIREAKTNKINVSCEVTPHHLLLCDEDIKDDGCYKMNPPLRSKNDQNALIQGLIDGTIDMIVTDHAPHTQEEKSRGYKNSLNGIVGLETSFALIYTNFVKNNLISFQRFIELMSSNACKLFHIVGGEIKTNQKANLTLANLNEE